jgi:hypothetical protein
MAAQGMASLLEAQSAGTVAVLNNVPPAAGSSPSVMTAAQYFVTDPPSPPQGSPKTTYDAIFDSGCTGIVGPFDQARALLLYLGSLLAGKCVPYQTTPLQLNAILPVLSFGIAGHWFDLEPYFYMNANCTASIVGDPRYSTTWVMGNTFMQKYFTTFDFDNKQGTFWSINLF